MRILHFIDSLVSGGKERRLLELFKGLKDKKGIVLDLAVMSDDIQYQAALDLGITIHVLLRKVKKDPAVFFQFLKLCRNLQPDIIHTWDSMTSIYALPAAKIRKIRLINGMITDAPPHFDRKNKNWIRSKITFPLSDAILANSRAGLKAYGSPEPKSYFIHSGFDFFRLENIDPPSRIRERFGIRTQKVVGMVAAFGDRKDHETYIKAAQNVLRREMDVTFLAVGDGQGLDRCKALVQPEFQERIRFPGRQSDVESIVNIFDIGVLLTNPDIHGEGISNALLEYMALGKPVIATKGGGNAELVLDGESGFMVPGKDQDEVTVKMLLLLRDEDRAREMGRQGRKRIEDEFSLEKMISSHISLYERLVLRTVEE